MRFTIVLYGAVLALLLLIGAPFFYWYLNPAVQMDVAVIDKTVPNESYREHKGLFWLLDHHKIVKSDGDAYNMEEDYHGYHLDEQRGNVKFAHPANPDLIYVTDTYGVYSEDLKGNPRGDRSELLYGGLTSQEWEGIIQAKNENTTLLMEFNSIASPTDSAVRKKVEETMSIQWSGWIGRYFPDMQDSEIPSWLIENYQEQNDQPWSFQGEGLVFIHDNDKVVVLDDANFDGRVLFQWNAEGREHYPNAKNSYYDYWFDIIEPAAPAVVEASYHVGLKANGQQTLKEHGIPSEFPAIIHNPVDKTYYFAGDYADVETTSWPKWVMPDVFYDMMAFIEPKEAFYWRSYFPMMTQILKEIKEGKQSSANKHDGSLSFNKNGNKVVM